MVVALGMPVGCATNKPEMAWVGTDGRRIGDDADLLKQGHTDIGLDFAACAVNRFIGSAGTLTFGVPVPTRKF
jgi:hypothetical protein